MIYYYYCQLMNWLGYKKVWYYPSDKGLGIADFYSWEYKPDEK